MEPRVVIAERDTLVRSLLRVVLSERGLRVVGEAASAAELVELCRAETPDVLVSDVELLSEQVILELTAESKQLRVLLLGADASPERVTAALVSGASGYLLHDSSPDEVAEAVHAVAAGDAALHPTVTMTILEQWRQLRADPTVAPLERLTPREREVLAALTEGLSNKAIARQLGVAVKTIENHKIHVFDKLGVRTHAQAVAVAIGQGLLAGALVPVGGGS